MNSVANKKDLAVIDLDELQSETEKLLSLLKDRQHGLISWNLCLKERMGNIHRISSVAVGGEEKSPTSGTVTKVKLIEYRWTEDTSMDPYGRSGDENERRGGMLIPGENCPTVLVLMCDGKPVFHEMTSEDSGISLWPEFKIDCNEWEFVEIGEIQLEDDKIQLARTMARNRRTAEFANSIFHKIFIKLDEEDD